MKVKSFEKEENLYHYTSIEVLKNIIENKTIRFSDYRFLNDPAEFKLGIETLNNFCKKIMSGEIYTSNQTIKKGAIDTLKIGNFVKEVFAISFSKSKDDLALWNSYAKFGVCIKFNFNALLTYLTDYRDFYIKNKIYDFKNILRGSVAYDVKDFYANAIRLFNNSDKLDLILNADFMYRLCILFKNKEWDYEKEYRCSVIVPRKALTTMDNNHLIKRVYTNDGNVLKPQIEFDYFPTNVVIEEIILSPYLTNELTIKGLQEFLKDFGFDPKIVKKSKILVRI